MQSERLIDPSAAAAANPADIVKWFENFHRVTAMRTRSGEPPAMVPFRLNSAQLQVMSAWLKHPRIILLKARQIGATTLAAHYFLYLLMTQANHNIYIWSYNADKRKEILNKIRSSLMLLSPTWQSVFQIQKMSDDEIVLAGLQAAKGVGRIFGNASSRGETLTGAEFSEVGYACNISPAAADEQRTAINAACPTPGPIMYDSTAYGPQGFHKDMFMTAWEKLLAGEVFGDNEFYPVFISWDMKPENWAPVKPGWKISKSDRDYFAMLTSQTKKSYSPGQRVWYATEKASLSGNSNLMKRENPSTPGEAFSSAKDGAFMVRAMEEAAMQGRIGSFPPNPRVPCSCFMDLGRSDYTAMTFYQYIDGNHRIIGYYQDHEKNPDFYATKIVDIAAKELRIQPPILYLPHDAKNRVYQNTPTWEEQIKAAYKHAAVYVLPKSPDKKGATNLARTFADICQFDEKRCAVLINCLMNVSYAFDKGSMTYDLTRLQKTEYNHGYDSFEQCAIVNLKSSGDIVKRQFFV